MSTTSIKQWGSGQGAPIPQEVLERSRIKIDDVLDVIASNGVIVLKKQERKKFSDFARPVFDTDNVKFDREEANAR